MIAALTKFGSKLSWRTAVIVLLITALLAPLIVGSDFFFPYVVPRNLYFRAVVELGIAALVLALSFGGRTLDLRDEPILLAFAAFVGALALSALLSPARAHSFFGDFERMGGVWAWLHLFLFFVLLRTLRDKDWTWILNAALGVSLIVSVIAIGQHAVQTMATPSVDAVPSAATFGNSGLLAAYLLISIALAAYLATTNVGLRLLYLAAGAVNLLALVYAENRSTILGLVLGALIGGVLHSLVGTRSRRRWVVPITVGIAAIALASCVLVIRQLPSSALARTFPTVLTRIANTNFTGADRSRTLQWQAAFEGFKDRPFTGYGPENHNLVWSAHFDPEIYKLDTDIFDRTHNEFLELLATTGLVGTLAFLGVWAAICVTMVRAYRCGRVSAPTLAVMTGLQVAYITYLFFWFVDLNSTMLWVLFAALIASRGTVGSVVLEVADREALALRPRPLLALVGVPLLIAVLYFEGYTPYQADLALARIDVPRGPLANTVGAFDVLTSSRTHQTAHTAILMEQFISSVQPQSQVAIKPEERQSLDRAIADAITAFEREIARDSLNDRLYTHEGELLAIAAHYYRSADYRQRAIDALHKAMDLSPRRLEQRLALADLYMAEHDYERAVVVLGDAVRVDPDVGRPRYRLAEAYLGAGRGDSALAMLQSSLKLGYVGAPEAYLAMGKRLEFSGKNTTAASLYSNYLEAKYTEAVWDRSQSIDRPVPTADIAVAAHLPLLYMRGRDSELAIKSAAALSAFDPSRSTLVDRFVSDVGSRRRAPWLARNSLLPCKSARSSRRMEPISLDACGVFRGKL